MTGKALNENSTGILILILPIAAAIILLYKAWPLLLVLLVLLIVWRVWDTYQWSQWNQELSPFFNELIQENQGCLTPMDLAVKTNLSGKAAKRFLDRKAEEYGALRKDRGEQGIVYYFLTATALGSIFDDSEPEALPESDQPSVEFEFQPPVGEESPAERQEKPKAEVVVASPPKTEEVIETEDTPLASPQGTEEVIETEDIPLAYTEETVTEDEPTATVESTSDAAKTTGSSPFAQLAALKEERQQASEIAKPDASVEETKRETPVSKPSAKQNQFSKGLIQADLAKRLDLNASTVGRRKSDPDFSEWSQSKDPDGIAWKYIRKSKLFVPMDS